MVDRLNTDDDGALDDDDDDGALDEDEQPHPLEPRAKRVFEYYARFTDGELSPNEVRIALIELGCELSFAETAQLVARHGMGDPPKLDVSRFLQLVRTLPSELTPPTEAIATKPGGDEALVAKLSVELALARRELRRERRAARAVDAARGSAAPDDALLPFEQPCSLGERAAAAPKCDRRSTVRFRGWTTIDIRDHRPDEDAYRFLPKPRARARSTPDARAPDARASERVRDATRRDGTPPPPPDDDREESMRAVGGGAAVDKDDDEPNVIVAARETPAPPPCARASRSPGFLALFCAGDGLARLSFATAIARLGAIEAAHDSGDAQRAGARVAELQREIAATRRELLEVRRAAAAMRSDVATADGALSSPSRRDGAPAASQSDERSEASSREARPGARAQMRARSFSSTPQHAAGPTRQTGRRASESSVAELRRRFETQESGGA